MVVLSLVQTRDVTEDMRLPREDNVSMGPGQPERGHAARARGVESLRGDGRQDVEVGSLRLLSSTSR